METALFAIVTIFAVLSTGIISLLARTSRLLAKSRSSAEKTDLPSVSICIPVRNEAHTLSACLDYVLQSNYEKLEVLVLDDGSIDHTPTLIKSFAHAGVRFIAGKALPAGWIGKNHALDTLAREASGDLILFIDVDIRLAPDTVASIVKSMGAKTNIISFIPERRDGHRPSALFGHLRYLWDMLQVGLGGVAASASVWCVSRDWLLETHNGFTNIRDTIRPELALATADDANEMFYLGKEFDIMYDKPWQSQMESSERLIVPTMRSYGFKMNLVAIWLSLWALILPLTLTALLVRISEVTVLLVVLVFLVGYTIQFFYLSMAWRSHAWLGALLWWWASIQEFVLMVVSIFRYATKTVTWKGRSIHAQPLNEDYYSIN